MAGLFRNECAVLRRRHLSNRGNSNSGCRIEFFEDYGVRLDSTEILKVSHHGSATGTGEEFVRYLGLETAVISCGENNFYGHPDAGVCERLSEAGAEIYRTDLLGRL